MASNRELSQNQLIDYLKDMSDIEVREFTLRKAIDELKYQQNRFKSTEELQARKEIAAAQKNLNQAKKELLRGRPESDAILQSPPKEPTKPDSWEDFQKKTAPEHYGKSDPFKEAILTPSDLIFSSVFIFVGIYIVLAVICLAAGFLLSSVTSADFDAIMQTGLPVLAFVSIIITVFLAIIRRKHSIKKYRKKTDKWQAECAEYKKASEPIEAYNRECALYPVDCENFTKYQNAIQHLRKKEAALSTIEKERKAHRAVLDSQIAALQPHIVTLFNQKYALYDLNIIPPDYRTLDCVLMLHQIFRNGLKDNMAEAVLLYEERVFRQEVIRGIDKIYEMLGDLNASMRAVEERLIDVRQEVQMMGNDLCGRLDHMAAQAEKSAQNQEMWMDSQERWQEDLLSETRASRYAAEAVQNSNYKYEWYMEQHRQGLL